MTWSSMIGGHFLLGLATDSFGDYLGESFSVFGPEYVLLERQQALMEFIFIFVTSKSDTQVSGVVQCT